MVFHKKIGAWLADYSFMLRGAAAGLVYQKPPKHYLDYTVAGKIPVILVPEIWGLSPYSRCF